MKNLQKGFVVPMLLVIIALLIIGGGVYVYENKKTEVPTIINSETQPLNQNQQTNTQTPPVTTLQADISNWKTATNTFVGFSFKYPSNWFVDDNLTINTCCLNITSYSTGAERLFAGQTMIQVQRYTKPVSQSLMAFASSPNELTGTSPKVETVTISGVQVVKSNMLGDGVYYLPKSETEGIRVISWSHPDTKQASQIFTQEILSTFKFIKVVANVEVAGMQQYTDSGFGFSFWYPKNWGIQQTATNTNLSDIYAGGTIVKRIIVAPSQSNEGIEIEEFISSDKSIRDNSGCGPADGCPSAVRYYFDSNTHKWMKDSYFDYGQYSSPTKTAPADISVNSMGGLHILRGNARFGDNVIVPLSAKNFLIVHNVSAGTNRVELLANTILALDPAVATPVSADQQIKTIHTEGLLYGALGRAVGDWYVDDNYVYNHLGAIIPGANPSTFRLINAFSDGYTSQATGFATDGIRVYSDWSNDYPILADADPATFIPIRQSYQIPYAQSSGKYGQSFTSYDTTFAKDKSQVWYKSKLIPGADSKTFVVTGDTHVQNSNGSYTLAHDANHVYGVDAKGNMTIEEVILQE